MLRTKLLSKKSKKGFTLVEALCAIFVLAIVFVGVLNAIAFARQMVFTNNARDKASYKGQLIADEILSTAKGYNPDGTEDPTAAIDSVINNVTDDPQNTDPDTAIGEVRQVLSLTDPDSFDPDAMSAVEYMIEPVGESYAEVMDDSVSVHQISETGWNITVRVFYKQIGKDNGYECIDISAFAPYNYIG